VWWVISAILLYVYVSPPVGVGGFLMPPAGWLGGIAVAIFVAPWLLPIPIITFGAMGYALTHRKKA